MRCLFSVSKWVSKLWHWVNVSKPLRLRCYCCGGLQGASYHGLTLKVWAGQWATAIHTELVFCWVTQASTRCNVVVLDRLEKIQGALHMCAVPPRLACLQVIQTWLFPSPCTMMELPRHHLLVSEGNMDLSSIGGGCLLSSWGLWWCPEHQEAACQMEGPSFDLSLKTLSLHQGNERMWRFPPVVMLSPCCLCWMVLLQAV